MKKISILIFTVLFCISLMACSNQKDNQYSSYDSTISSIYGSIIEYIHSNNISIFDVDKVISDVEELTNSKCVGGIASGRDILKFIVDEHLSFTLNDIPITSVSFMIDDKDYKAFSIA